MRAPTGARQMPALSNKQRWWTIAEVLANRPSWPPGLVLQQIEMALWPVPQAYLCLRLIGQDGLPEADFTLVDNSEVLQRCVFSATPAEGEHPGDFVSRFT